MSPFKGSFEIIKNVKQFFVKRRDSFIRDFQVAKFLLISIYG